MIIQQFFPPVSVDLTTVQVSMIVHSKCTTLYFFLSIVMTFTLINMTESIRYIWSGASLGGV